MSDFQQLLIVGTIAHSVNIFTTNDGKTLATFIVRVTERWLDNELKPNLKVTDFTVLCWNDLAEIADKSLTVEDRVMVVGTIAAREYNGRGVRPTVVLELRAAYIEILEKAIHPHANDAF